MPETSTLFDVREVSKTFPGSGEEPLRVLNSISLKIGAGETLALLGPSGSGKSTVLNLLGGLDRPSGGKILYENEDVGLMSESALAAWRNRRVGFVFQSHHLLPQCTVLENVLVPTICCSDAALVREAPDRARKLLDRVGLSSRITHRPGQLSGGERQRVAAVRALINQPRVLLADEPTGALDRANAQELTKVLLELNRELNVTLVVATHALDLAAQLGRTLRLQDGRVVENA